MSAQETRVFPLAAAAGARLQRELAAAGFRFRPAPHARFQAQGAGVTATLYSSGKLVVQGRGLDAWCERFLAAGTAALQPGARAGDAPLAAELPALGSDEAGKGDTFGPLVVCAVALRPEHAAALEELAVADSKRMSDARLRPVAAALRDLLPHEERVLEPEEYNRRHREHGGSVNRLLAALHAETLAVLARRSGVARAVVDRFGEDAPVGAALRAAGAGLLVTEVPRAERHPAVAAASVLARDRFLESLQRLSEWAAVDLPRGSGAPVAPALRRALAIHGAAGLPRLAKMHFRNVQQALQGLPWS